MYGIVWMHKRVLINKLVTKYHTVGSRRLGTFSSTFLEVNKYAI